MEPNHDKKRASGAFGGKHPVLVNAAIIIAVAVLGICIVYLSFAIFTRHGQSRTVPGVEGISYTDAIIRLHDSDLRYEIRDSLYREDVKPGMVIEQFPKRGATVKPGRKIFLYINAVNPKEVVIDDDNHPRDFALKGASVRQALARMEELGFKNVRIVRVLGDNEYVLRVLADGMPVRKTQKVPVTASIVLEISDGRLTFIRDSLTNIENTSMPHPEELPDYNNSEEQPSYYEPRENEPASPYIEPENNEEENEYLE